MNRGDNSSGLDFTVQIIVIYRINIGLANKTIFIAYENIYLAKAHNNYTAQQNDLRTKSLK